jgi:hypothetical protein
MPEPAPAAPPAAVETPTPDPNGPITAAESSFITGSDVSDQPNATPTPEPKPDATGTPAATPEPKPEPTPATEPTPKPEAKPAEKPDDPLDVEIPENLPPKGLRLALKRAKEDRRRLYQELTQLKEAAAKPAVPAEDPERKALEERFTAADKRRQELEDHIRYLDYTKSEEYQEKYQKPYTEAWQDAVERVVELKITNAETGESRQATQDDLSAILKIPNGEEALTAAENLFGTPAKAALVMSLRNDIRKAYLAAEKAKAEFREKGSQRQKEWEEGQTKAAATRATMFEKLNKEAAEKFPHFFKPVEGDDEGNKLLEKGYQQADLAFSGTLTPEQQVPLHSIMRNKAAGFDRLALLLNREKKLREAAEKKLADFQKSEPKPGEGSGGVAAPTSAEDALEKALMERSQPA